MKTTPDQDRYSQPEDVVVAEDPEERARLEGRNGLLQFDEVKRLAQEALEARSPFRLRPSTILRLNGVALQDIERLGGTYRTGGMTIENSTHNPPVAEHVPRLFEEMCDYVNDHWDRSALHLAAYVMWRINWIHPFVDGNGRTARAASYLILCVRLGYVLPGTKTIPEHIVANKKPYWDALEKADEVWKQDEIVDVFDLEQYLKEMLSAQLLSVVEAAGDRNR